MDDVRLIRVEFVFIVDGLRVGSHQFPFLLIPKSNIFLFTVLFPFFFCYIEFPFSGLKIMSPIGDTCSI